jgi:hypothetical protein
VWSASIVGPHLPAVTWEPLHPDGRDGRLLRVYRFAVDDLRLFKAIVEAGMLGRIIVVDRISEADLVLATKHRRTGKEASLTPVGASQKQAEAWGWCACNAMMLAVGHEGPVHFTARHCTARYLLPTLCAGPECSCQGRPALH